MKVWILISIVAASSLTVLSQTCPLEPFSAVFTASLDQTFDTPSAFPQDDPELVFFKHTCSSEMKLSSTLLMMQFNSSMTHMVSTSLLQLQIQGMNVSLRMQK